MSTRKKVNDLIAANEELAGRIARLEMSVAIQANKIDSLVGQVDELRTRLWPLFAQGADRNAELIEKVFYEDSSSDPSL